MLKSDKKYLESCIMTDGFNYTFINYSSFKEIKDEKFQELRKAYVEAHNKLYLFLDEQGLNLEL